MGQANGYKSRGHPSKHPASPKSRSLPSGTRPYRRAHVNTSDLVYSILCVQSHSVTPFAFPPWGHASPQSHLQCHNGCKCSGTSYAEQLNVTQTVPSPSRSSLCHVPLGHSDRAESSPEKMMREVNLVSQAGKPVLHPPPQAHGHRLDGSGDSGPSAGHPSPPPCCYICTPKAQEPNPPFTLLLSFFLRSCV